MRRIYEASADSTLLKVDFIYRISTYIVIWK